TNMLSQTEAAISRNLDTEGHKKILLSLKEEQTNLIELTNSLLLISQYEKIVFQDTWPQLRIDEVLYDTIATCKRMFINMDISLDFTSLPENESQLLVACNDTLLKSAFRNLIKNAYNYSNNQKVNIVIEVKKPSLKIIFINTGNQLTSAEIDKMKMPFFRGQNAVNKKGFGLGLSIVNKIIELHKGSIVYNAINDNINQFVITLPIA
ncbi:MAG: HAMP domain-containing histidine kinase, partial [Deinococcales bacterium]|nr:HAMP domain-containing histidine kinase [Chitinophagaceae bacterium]